MSYKSKALQNIELEITHRCNKMCELCDHRIRTSSYDHLTRAQYKYIVSCIEQPEEMHSVLLTGGEPLCHPDFKWLAKAITRDFKNARLKLQTNGKLLSEVDEGLLDNFYIILSEYPGFNDDIVQEYLNYDGVRVIRFHGFWDPYRDPNLDEETAKEIRARCIYQVRLVGTRIYGCCLSEGIERYYQTEPVHVEFSRNWQEDWQNLPTWKACQHCFRAIDWFT